MDKRKIFFIGGILLLAVIYTAGTVWGATKPGSSKSDSGFTLDPTQLAKQLGGIGDSLAKPPALTAQEILVDAAGSSSSDCLKLQGDLLVPAGATCQFTITAVERSLVSISPTARRLELTLVEGEGVELTLEEKVKQDNGNEMDMTVEHTLQPAVQAKSVDVYPSGGKLTLTCQKGASAANCRLKLANNMEKLRTPFFIVAIILIVIVVLIEVGNTAMLNAAPTAPNCATLDSQELRDSCQQTDLSPGLKGTPGMAIAYMALLDGVTLFTAVLMGLGLVVKPSILGRIQGCGTLIFALLIILGGIVMIFIAIALVFLMIGLLLSFPFGTIAYLILYGHFDTGSARAVLSLLMTLKLAFSILLVIGHQRFLQNLGLVLIVITSLLGNVIITFLHGFPPGFLVSISDVIGAIVVAILAVIWAIFLLIGSIPAILASIRLARL